MHHNRINQLSALLLAALLTLAYLPALVAQQQKPRFFTDDSGKFRVKATIVNLDETTVKLRKVDGQEIDVPIARLSDRDQQYLKQTLEAYRKMVGDFPIGTRVEIFSSGGWHLGVVLQVQPGKYLVDFDQYSDSWNKWVTAQELRLVKPSASSDKTTAGKTTAEGMKEGAANQAGGTGTGPLAPDQAAKQTDDGATQPGDSSQVVPPSTGDLNLPVLSLEATSAQLEPGSIQGRRFLHASGSPSWEISQPLALKRRLDSRTLPLNSSGDAVPEEFLPSPNRHFALVIRGQETYCLDLEQGKWQWIKPATQQPDLRALAINDTGRRVAFAIENANDEPLGVCVYEVEGTQGRLLWQWQPIPSTSKLSRIKKAIWMTDDRIGLLDENQFAVWNPVRKRLGAVLSGGKGTKMLLSPDGSQLAFLVQYRLAIYRTDGMRLNALTLHLGWDHRFMSFQPSGKNILFSGGKELVVVSTQDGKVTKLPIDERLSDQRVEWIDNQYALVGNGMIYDFKSRVPVWTLNLSQNSGSSSPNLLQVVDEKLVIGDTTRSRLLLKDLSEVVDESKIAQGPAALNATYPGVKIATEIIGNGASQYGPVIEQQLQTIIKRNGWVHDPSSSLILQAGVYLRNESVTYETKSIIGLDGGNKNVTVPFANFRLRILKDAKTVYLRGWTSLVQTIVRIPRSQSLQEYVTEKSKPDPNLFVKQEVPATIQSGDEDNGFGSTNIWELE